jgi:hypothetical protein
MRRFYQVLCVLSLTFFLIPGLSVAEGVHGVLRVVKGQVQIKSAKDGKVTRAKIGQKVFPQDTIITGADSRAKVVMIDNNEINVSPDSEVRFDKYEYKPEENKKDVLLNVIYGKVRSKVEQKYDGKTTKFQVKTPSAVAGVRGTDFLTSFDSSTKATNVVTFRGTVALGTASGGSPVLIGMGQTASALPGRAPSAPTAVPAGQLNSMDKESKAETGASGTNDSSAAPAEKEKKESGDKGKQDDDAGKSEGKENQPAAKDEGVKGSGNDKSAGGGASSASTATGDKKPALTMDKRDVLGAAPQDSRGPASTAPLAPPPPPPMVTPPPAPPVVQPVAVPRLPDYVNEVIQNGNTTVNVIIKNQ